MATQASQLPASAQVMPQLRPKSHALGNPEVRPGLQIFISPRGLAGSRAGWPWAEHRDPQERCCLYGGVGSPRRAGGDMRVSWVHTNVTTNQVTHSK